MNPSIEPNRAPLLSLFLLGGGAVGVSGVLGVGGAAGVEPAIIEWIIIYNCCIISKIN